MKTVNDIVLPKYSKKKTLFICTCGRTTERIYRCGIRSKNCGRCWEYELNTTRQYYQLAFDDEIFPQDTTNSKKWWKCSCGNRKLIIIKSILSGYTKSCGCRNKTPMVGSCDHRKLETIRPIDLYGKKFGKLTLIDKSEAQITIGSETLVLFRCDCGKQKQIKLGGVTRDRVKTCGQCNLKPLESYGGQKFGHLTVRSGQTGLIGQNSDAYVKCDCSCGNQHDVRAEYLFSGRTTTCGNCSTRMHDWWTKKDRLAVGGTTSKKNKYPLSYLIDYFDGSYLTPLHSIDALRFPIKMKCKLCGSIFTTRLDWVYHSKVISCGCISFKISRINTTLGQKLIDLGCDVAYEAKVGGYSYDLLVNRKVLCECHGLRYHSTELRSSRKTDRLKFQIAYDNAYEYMMIYEDEISNDQIAKLVAVRSGSSVSKYTIRPQNLSIKQVKSKDLNTFYNDYHYLGKVSAGLNYIITYNETIIAGISFRHPTRQNTNGLELCRMCVNSDYRVHGLWSWFFAHTTISRPIVSYSDNRLFNGETYRKLGFRRDGDIKQDYYWVKGSKRHHKSKLRKPKGCVMTEFELRENQGYHRIYDLGKTRWVLN